jgi:hypothetical protein
MRAIYKVEFPDHSKYTNSQGMRCDYHERIREIAKLQGAHVQINRVNDNKRTIAIKCISELMGLAVYLSFPLGIEVRFMQTHLYIGTKF